LSAAKIEHVVGLRLQRLTGEEIAQRLGLPRSTVAAHLSQLGMGRLPPLHPPPPVIRYERERPGELIHIDSKKLGRFQRLGHRITGNRHQRRRWACQRPYRNSGLCNAALRNGCIATTICARMLSGANHRSAV
jgi:hypothetical protein